MAEPALGRTVPSSKRMSETGRGTPQSSPPTFAHSKPNICQPLRVATAPPGGWPLSGWLQPPRTPPTGAS
eukprot:13487513-Alexandrium_andersonii.AAC.2